MRNTLNTAPSLRGKVREYLIYGASGVVVLTVLYGAITVAVSPTSLMEDAMSRIAEKHRAS